MTTTDSLKVKSKTSTIYMPLMPYGNIFCHILSHSNNKNMCKIISEKSGTMSESEKKERQYWADKFAYDHAGDNGYYPIRYLDKYEIKFDPEAVFDLITTSMRNDKDIINFMKAFEPTNDHDLDD